MVLGSWLIDNWFTLLQTLGIVGGFAIASHSLSLDSRSRRAELHFAMTASHRDIWEHFLDAPSLAAVLDPARDASAQPASPEEERFVLMVLLHAASVFHATELKAIRRWPGWHADMEAFVALPVPSTVARRFLEFQEPSFQAFLAGLLHEVDAAE